MKNMKLNAITLAVTATLGLAACNDTGSGSAANQQAITAAKSTTGVITGFGSVFVNGVEYETDTASVEMDGAAAAESGLKIGMVITIDGSVNADGTTGTAAAIKFADEVEGIMTALDLGLSTMTVMGQTVHFDADTKFESYDPATVATIDQVPMGAIVEISGYSSGGGDIYATRVEAKKASHAAGEEIELKGLIAELDVIPNTFKIGAQVVSYDGAGIEGTLSNGLYVEVKSTNGFDATSGYLVASKVELEDGGEKGAKGDEGEETELEGVITMVISDSEIQVNGQTVNISDAEFKDGVTVADLVEKAKVKVECEFAADGSLMAKEIKLKKSGDTKMLAAIDAVDVANNTVTIMGQTVQLNTTTTMDDERDQGGNQPERYFDVSDIAAGDWVEVKLYKDDSGTLTATKLERDDNEGKPAELEGTLDSLPVAAAGGGMEMIVAGVSVSVSANVTLPTLDTLGVKVEMSGGFTNGVFVASEVSAE